jgi:hypothetical protein
MGDGKSSHFESIQVDLRNGTKGMLPMNEKTFQLLLLDERLAVCRMDPDASLPGWATQGRFFSITRTAEELSIVCAEAAVHDGVKVVKNWRVLRLVGAMDFSVVGVLASLTTPLAEAKVGLFAISTFDTDYLLVQESDLDRAIEVLVTFGHDVTREDSTA